LIQRASPVRSLVIPYLLGGTALTVAFVGALLTGDDNVTGGANGFVELLSGRATSFLGKVGLLAPLGFAFAAGMVATVNPCGFAMLPAYLGLYMGSSEEPTIRTNAVERLGRALMVTGVITTGFILLFGVTGLVIGVGASFVVSVMPWIGMGIGVLLAVAGSWMLSGGKLYTGAAGRVANRIGNPNQVGFRGYFLFGLSYGTASLSCTLPIFLVVVGTTLAVSGIPAAVAQFVLYAMGMGFIIMLLTVGMALFQSAAVGTMRKALPYIQPVSAGMMILAGSYIVFYWLTLGGLL